jgi:outer membrane protein assembly factor BamA
VNNFFKLIVIMCCVSTIIKGMNTDTLFYKGNYSVVIDSIVIEGNDITENYIILRELTFKTGDTLNPKLASYNRERIYSLDIFNEVKLKPFEYENKNFLLITIEESWYIYPIPFITLKDRDWSKLSYGLRLRLKNFRGRNETLSGIFGLGYDPSFNFFYTNPNLVYSLDLFASLQLGYAEINNESKIAEELADNDFTQKLYYGKFIFGKRFGLYHRLSVSLGLDYIETPFYIKGISASNQRIDRTIILGFTYNYDTRDLAQYATNGIFALVNYEFKGMGINNVDYRISYLDFREYRRLFGDLTGKWRFATRHTNGKVPFYDNSFIGLRERLRGHWTDLQEGNDYYVGSLEFNYYILSDYRLNLYFIPWLPKSLLSYRVGLVGELFVDTGTTRFNGQPLTLRQFNTGYGTGISILFLPYFISRLEFALNEIGNSEFIFDLSASF